VSRPEWVLSRCVGRPRSWAHVYADADHDSPCKHGHLDCATTEGGPCVDEVLTNHEAAGGCPECD
jgi:hypothetical protein